MPLYAARSPSWPGRPHRLPASLFSLSFPVDLVITVHGRGGQARRPGLALQAERSGLPGPAMATGHIPTARPRAPSWAPSMAGRGKAAQGLGHFQKGDRVGSGRSARP